MLVEDLRSDGSIPPTAVGGIFRSSLQTDLAPQRSNCRVGPKESRQPPTQNHVIMVVALHHLRDHRRLPGLSNSPQGSDTSPGSLQQLRVSRPRCGADQFKNCPFDAGDSFGGGLSFVDRKQGALFLADVRLKSVGEFRQC